jgi:hypothetical protein
VRCHRNPNVVEIIGPVKAGPNSCSVPVLSIDPGSSYQV